ncbi:MAG: SpoIIIAH-like family protein [Paenibacillus macerans]|uniref:SpoIIIAH-like family protein n=1 Tax=Paenibacillus macerans TaxID=44252 RepID=UPI00291252B2|nr:SpoIIIAH-like family protein [Paenibacillus macerans]MDU7472005.1 SpoIIIAH-like family protein [Paenibacillus macerans]
MKSKRQTIWLVSMLSLMVVLSAYYLFTEEGPAPAAKTDGQQVSMDGGTAQNGGLEGSGLSAQDEVILSEVASDGEAGSAAVTDDEAAAKTDDSQAAKEEAATEESGAAGGAADASSQNGGKEAAKEGNSAAEGDKTAEPSAGAGGPQQTKTDEDLLKQMEAQGIASSDSLTAYQFERTQENLKKQEELMQAINDEKKSLEESAMAQQELSALEEKEEKIYDIEERLRQQYANAVVAEDGNKYKVVVVSEKMEAKEAVSIMDLVMKELDVSQDKVSVQYVTQ